VHAGGIEGARAATGTVVVIDVLRAFTVSAYALAGGATACRLVREVAEARALADRIPGAALSAEVDGLPVPGIAISNSPTQVRAASLSGRVLIQRTSAGTQAASAAAEGAERLLAGSLVVAGATARAILAHQPAVVTLVASRPDHEEDQACAHHLEALLRGVDSDLEALLAAFARSERYQRLATGRTAGFPATDVELALTLDSLDFAMPIQHDELGLVVRPLRC
jgi:2-phosphosulfolactate phosphatase